MGRSQGGSQVCTVWRPGSGFPLTGQLLIQKCCHLTMLKNILCALRQLGHSPQHQHAIVGVPINCFFPPEEERSLHFITAWNTKTCIYGLSLECRVMVRRFGLPHTWMLCLPFDHPTGSCLWLCLHTHQSCHNRQLIHNAS